MAESNIDRIVSKHRASFVVSLLDYSSTSIDALKVA